LFQAAGHASGLPVRSTRPRHAAIADAARATLPLVTQARVSAGSGRAAGVTGNREQALSGPGHCRFMTPLPAGWMGGDTTPA